VILVRDGMRVGLVTYVATSPRTEQIALELGLNVLPFNTFDGLDLAIDGADQVAPSGWLIKGGGGAPSSTNRMDIRRRAGTCARDSEHG
jgi:ribose 5-phosphate isomerase